jgi:hypothetical protein
MKNTAMSEGREEFKERGCNLHKTNRRKADWIGHIVRRNCLLKHVIEGKMEGRSDGKTRKKT